MNAEVHIRWLTRADMDSVLAIEQQSFTDPWTKMDFDAELSHKNVIGMVVCNSHNQVIGHMVYEILKSELRVKTFAVAPAWRRQGVGTVLWERLLSKLSPDRRRRVECYVNETNLDGQLFLRAVGARAVEIWHGYYEPEFEDAYVFEACCEAVANS